MARGVPAEIEHRRIETRQRRHRRRQSVDLGLEAGPRQLLRHILQPHVAKRTGRAADIHIRAPHQSLALPRQRAVDHRPHVGRSRPIEACDTHDLLREHRRHLGPSEQRVRYAPEHGGLVRGEQGQLAVDRRLARRAIRRHALRQGRRLPHRVLCDSQRHPSHHNQVANTMPRDHRLATPGSIDQLRGVRIDPSAFPEFGGERVEHLRRELRPGDRLRRRHRQRDNVRRRDAPVAHVILG